MGTSNFCRYSARKTYAVISDDDLYGEYVWDDTRTNVSVELEETARKNGRTWIDNDKIKFPYSLSYPSQSIGYYRDTISLYGVEWEIRLTTKTVDGYYADFTLDYDIEISQEISGDWIEAYRYSDNYADDIEKIIDDIIKYDSEYLPHKGLFIARKDDIKNKLINFIDTMRDEVESVFQEYSTPLEVAARFSNGETIYTIATDNKQDEKKDEDMIYEYEEEDEDIIDDEDIGDNTDDSFPIIYIGSNRYYSEQNKKAFDKINDILLDKQNPFYDIFNEERLYLDDTDGFISLVQTNHEEDFSDIAKGIADYIVSKVGFDDTAYIYVGDTTYIKVDYNLDKLNKLKDKQSDDKQQSDKIRKNR